MDLTIRQNCPSCGAPIELNEADRLLQCPFCEVNNYMVNRGPLRFVLPDKVPPHISSQDVFYVPYLRFKGNVYYCIDNTVRQKIIDTTHLAVNAAMLPRSLGLRPQAMVLSQVSEEHLGGFFRSGVKQEAIIDKAVRLSELDNKHQGKVFLHRAFIGETLSYVYLPLYMEEGVLHDGVTNSVLARGGSVEKLRAKTSTFQDQWQPHFLNTLCPGCGETLNGEHDSLVLSCRNCHSSWEENGGKFRELSWEMVPSAKKSAFSLPFWKIQVSTKNIDLDRFSDYLRITNQPIVIQKSHEEQEFFFWIPAFKVRPKVFLTLAKTITLAQHRLGKGVHELAGRLHPVTLDRQEAVESMKTVLAESVLNQRDFFPLLPQIELKPTRVSLVYLPFNYQGHDYIQEQTTIAVAASVLQFGRSL